MGNCRRTWRGANRAERDQVESNEVSCLQFRAHPKRYGRECASSSNHHFLGSNNSATAALSTATRASISHFSHSRLVGLSPPRSMCGAAWECEDGDRELATAG